MTALGISALFLIALPLIFSIDHTLNHIWQLRSSRKLVVSSLIYSTLKTIGPILIGMSLITPPYIISLTDFIVDNFTLARRVYLGSLPIASLLSFMLLYLLVPNTKVHFGSAVWGALIASILFEISKYFLLFI